MSKGVFMPVDLPSAVRPFANGDVPHFRDPAANTIPLFTQDPEFVEAIFGEEAIELTLLDERPQEKILDILRRPSVTCRL